MLPVVSKQFVIYIHASSQVSNLLIHETSDSDSGTALDSSNDGIPGLDQARTIPIIMKDSEAAAAAPI